MSINVVMKITISLKLREIKECKLYEWHIIIIMPEILTISKHNMIFCIDLWVLIIIF